MLSNHSLSIVSSIRLLILSSDMAVHRIFLNDVDFLFLKVFADKNVIESDTGSTRCSKKVISLTKNISCLYFCDNNFPPLMWL